MVLGLRTTMHMTDFMSLGAKILVWLILFWWFFYVKEPMCVIGGVSQKPRCYVVCLFKLDVW